jgi:hypothetical protein
MTQPLADAAGSAPGRRVVVFGEVNEIPRPCHPGDNLPARRWRPCCQAFLHEARDTA